MKRTWLAMAAVVAVSSASSAQSTIEGDAYVRVGTGDTVPTTARVVYLLPKALVDSALAQACVEGPETGDARRNRIRARTDSLEMLFTARAVTSAKTGLKAHYSLKGVSAGAYRVWLLLYLGTHSYRWLVPVEVDGKSAISLDLDSSNVEETPVIDPFCSTI